MMGFPKHELQVLAVTLAFVIAAWVIVVLITSCDDGYDGDDDTECDPRYEECGATDGDADADSDADGDPNAPAGCTKEWTGYDWCACVSPYVCEYENYVWWAPGCDADDDPNDMEAANICCCYEYD